MSQAKPTVVLVHGAWHGAWCWQRVIPLLESRGLAVRTVELPSVGAARDAEIGLEEDAAAVKSVIDQLRGPVLLCGHSYGGMVISRASFENPRVARLVYLCAFVPDSDESLVDLGGGRLAPWIQLLEGGLTLPDPAQAARIFYDDCDALTQRWACDQLRPQCGVAYTGKVRNPGWKGIPSTYIVCSADNGVPPDWQRNVLAPRLDKAMELESGHSPFLSKPDALADLLAAEASAC
jgi:pimeloyl-ACP methyl ester carboxylesterase